MFRTQMPLIYELRDLIVDRASPDAYFQNFEDNVRDSPHHVRAIYLRWERELHGLDSDAWKFLKCEARPYLVSKDKCGRGWQQLFDILNQARAYNYLRILGCLNVRFIPRAKRQGLRTPDLEATLGSARILCEVKTINISEGELRARNQLTVRGIAVQLDAGFFRKLRSDVTDAKNQMQAMPCDRRSTPLSIH